ncbi:MAG: DUF2249 domain-containing protein [Actinomycetes bacterium]
MDIRIDSGTDFDSTSGSCAGGSCTCGKGNLPSEILDVRMIPASVRHAAVHGALSAIPKSGTIVLAAPHDPIPLLAELQESHPGEFEVAYLERGPENWLLKLTRQE